MQRYAHQLCVTGLLAASLVTVTLLCACAIPISQAKLFPDLTLTDVGPVVVTASSPDVFYVQDPITISGIRARQNGHPYVPGMMVHLFAMLLTDMDGERFLQVNNGNMLGPGPFLRPLFAANKYIGGEDYHFEPISGSGQRGITGGIGLNNVGTLISVSGAMIMLEARRFEIEDGSGAGLTVETAFDGLVVHPNSHYQVTGAVSLRRIVDQYLPVVWVGDAVSVHERYGARGKCTAWIGDNEIDGPDTVKKGKTATYSIHQPVVLGCGECQYLDDGLYRWADCEEKATYLWFMHGYIPGVNGRFDFVGARDQDTVEIKGVEPGEIDIDCEITLKCKSLPGCADSATKTVRKKITITDP